MATRKRVVEVHSLADEIRIFEADRLIAVHPVLEGCHQRLRHAPLRYLHLLAGYPPPTASPLVAATFAGIRRDHRRPLRKETALVVEPLRAALRAIPTPARAARPRPAARRFRGGAAALRIGPARHRRADPARGWHRAVPVVALASTPTSPTSLHDQPSGNFAQSALTRYLNLPASDNHCGPSLRKIVRPPPPPYAVA